LKLAGQCGKLKCCLNYELDTYLDALKDIPDRVENLQTEVGTARHQKTDIFKKLMWFSYPNQEDWIPLKVDRVKEIMAMNKKGQKPSNLKDEAVELATTVIVEKAHDYENVVGQDSLTRLDDKPRNKNNRNSGNNNNRNNRDRPAGGNRPERTERAVKSGQPTAKAPQSPKPAQSSRPAPSAPKAPQQNPKPNENRRGPEVRKAPEAVKTEEGGEVKAPSASRNNRSRNNRRRNKPSDKPKNEEN